MKKILFLTILLALSSCAAGNPDEYAKLVWSSNDGFPAWKGERKSLCAELQPLQDLKGVTVQVSDLKNGDSKIKASQLKAQLVSYVMADVLDTVWFGQCGWRPAGQYDSLSVPEILDMAVKKDVPAGQSQPIWLTVSIPQDATPGQYRGKLKVTAEGGYRWTLPYELEVIDETLPEPKDWKFHLDLWQNPYSVARYHGVELWSKEHFEAMRPVMELLAGAGQKVVTATILDRPWNGQTYDAFGSMVKKVKYDDGHWEYDFSVFDRWVEFMFSVGIDRQINCYSMIPWKLTFDYIDGETGETKYITSAPGEKEYAYYWTSFISEFAAHLKEKGWFEKTMLAMDERPMEAMKLAMDVIRSAEPDFKVSLAGNYHPELAYDLADYCIALQQHFPDDVLAGRKEKGLVSTVYTCCAEAHPNTFVVSDPMEAVWLGWHALAGGYDGYLRWAYNSWTADPMKDARFERWPAGDCFIVYPDGRSSVHFEKLIEGLQDYEKARIMLERWYEAGNGEKLNMMYDALEAFTLPELLENGPEEALKAAKSLINPRPIVHEPEMNVIFDTDIGGDVDDVPALQMVLNYHRQGRINLKAVTLVKDNPKVVPFVDGYLRFNAVEDVPLGYCHDGTGHEDWYYLIPTLAACNSRGEKLIRPKKDTPSDVEEAYRVMRRALVETEGKTTLIAVGYYTNLKRLLLSEGDDISPDTGIELVRKKVDKVYVMGGMFREEGFLPEWNVLGDLEGAKVVFERCPVEVIALGWEIGVMLPYPHRSILEDFGKPEDHPLCVAYCNYAKMPYDRPCWDPATVYIALEPDQDIYDLTPAGTIHIDDEGYSRFTEDPAGRHRYVKLSEANIQRALDEIVRMTAGNGCPAE